MSESSRFPVVVLFAMGILLAAGNAQALVHPDGWHTVTDIERVRQKLAAGAEPWVSAKAALLASGPTSTHQPSPLAVVSRGPANNSGNGNLRSDAFSAFSTFSTFTGDTAAGEKLSIYVSSDALNFTLLSNTGFSGTVRDPSIMKFIRSTVSCVRFISHSLSKIDIVGYQPNKPAGCHKREGS